MFVLVNGLMEFLSVSGRMSTGRVCRRRHRDVLHGGGTRVLHQGYEQWEEEERHCALFTAGRRENTSFNTIVPDRTVGTGLDFQRDSMNEVFARQVQIPSRYKYHAVLLSVLYCEGSGLLVSELITDLENMLM